VGTGLEPRHSFVAEDTLSLGSVNYKHVSVTYGNGGHFVCRVKFGKKWYAYNDMGHSQGRDHRLAIIETGETGIEGIGAPKGYLPTSYTYIRMDAMLEGVSPVGLVVKHAKQFHSMRLIWDEE
jgi:hypothetical protein